MELIAEAVSDGARVAPACDVLGISTPTYYRWKNACENADRRKGAARTVARKLTEQERQQIVDHCCSKRFQDDNPRVIHAKLLDEGIYIASESSFYRVLRERGLLRHRSESRPAQRRAKPEQLRATGPNQVFSWDVTYLPTRVKGIYLFLYMLVDVWSRKIVAWEIHDQESEEYAREFFRRVAAKQNLEGVRLHSDNGNAMKAQTVLILLYSLGIGPSFSRPRVSNDNPYSESLFKTLKYVPGYPGRFQDMQHAREWVASFVDWYNRRHLHSGIGYITPQQRHEGKVSEIMSRRNEVLQQAFERNPHRWSRHVKRWDEHPVVYLNPDPETIEANRQKAA